MAPDNVALRITSLRVRYGRVAALQDVSLEIGRDESVGILGANGTGKTTLLNTLSGFLKPYAGRVELFGERIDGLAPHEVVRRGLLHVSQERDLFGHLTVFDNLKLGASVRSKERFEVNLERVFGYFPRLKERRDQVSRTMSGGEQQMLAISRALMAEPRLLVLDEPSAGLSPLFVSEIGNMLAALKATNLVILLVEQNMSLAAKVVDRFVIQRDGRVVAEGRGEELRGDHEELVRTYYL